MIRSHGDRQTVAFRLEPRSPVAGYAIPSQAALSLRPAARRSSHEE
jgi:hypothetical protein